MIKVTILDDHKMVLEGLKTMLDHNDTVQVVSTYSRGDDLLRHVGEDNPDVLLLDINLPDANGIELCKKLLTEYPSLRIIGLSNYSESSFVKNMLRNGAKGYLLKNTERKEIVNAIVTVMEGGTYLPESLKNMLLNESIGTPVRSGFIPKLTRRETEVLNLIAQEHTNQEIANTLCISTKTVESHRNNLIQKLGVRNTAGLIKTAMEKGLLS